MNLLVGSLLLFILIAPGIIFRYAYLQGTYAKQTFRVSAIDEIFWALAPALFFQFLGVIVLEAFFDYNVRIDFVYNLLTGEASGIDFDIVKASFLSFFIYTTILIVIAATAGFLIRFVVRKLQLDLRYPFLRLNNEWYYLFSGEILDLLDAPGESKNIEMIQIDALVNTGEGIMIYCGTLENYYLSKDNGLDRLYLSNVYRRKFQDDSGTDPAPTGYAERFLNDRYYSMPGDLFVITYDKIINLNITYHCWTRVAEEAEKKKQP